MLTISRSSFAYVTCFPAVYCHKCFHKIYTATTERFHSCTIPTFVLTFYKKMQRISNTYVYLDFCFLPGHASILQAFSSWLGPLQALPPFFADVTIVLFLSCSPFPQDLEHFDHSPQEDCLQSIGQASILQAFSSLLGPLHALPPFLAGVTIVLVLSCTPFPQDLEHFDHSPQEDCLQSVVWDFELPIFFLPPLHMPHVFLQFCDTNDFANAWPHKNAVQCPTLSSHGSTKSCNG